MRYNHINYSAKFPAGNRLLRNNGFNHVLRSERVANTSATVFYLQNAIKNSRLGIVASKKNYSKAVDRNQIKRVIREVFRHHTIKDKSLDLVVLVKGAYFDNGKKSDNDLAILFSKIEEKCAHL